MPRHDTVAVRPTPSNWLYYEECSRNSNFEYEMTKYDAHLSRAAWSSADFKSQSGQVTSKPLYRMRLNFRGTKLSRMVDFHNIRGFYFRGWGVVYIWYCIYIL